jgi:hypothetical protein
MFRRIEEVEEFDYYRTIRLMKRLEGIDPDIRGVLQDMKERARLYHLTDEKRNRLQQLANKSEEFLQQLDHDFPV